MGRGELTNQRRELIAMCVVMPAHFLGRIGKIFSSFFSSSLATKRSAARVGEMRREGERAKFPVFHSAEQNHKNQQLSHWSNSITRRNVQQALRSVANHARVIKDKHSPPAFSRRIPNAGAKRKHRQERGALPLT